MKDIEYYMALPYTRLAAPMTDEGVVGFVAHVAEIPWIKIHGSTHVEALLRLQEIFASCIQAMIDEGVEVPEPAVWPEGYGDVSKIPAPVHPEDAVALKAAGTSEEEIVAGMRQAWETVDEDASRLETAAA